MWPSRRRITVAALEKHRPWRNIPIFRETDAERRPNKRIPTILASNVRIVCSGHSVYGEELQNLIATFRFIRIHFLRAAAVASARLSLHIWIIIRLSAKLQSQSSSSAAAGCTYGLLLHTSAYYRSFNCARLTAVSCAYYLDASRVSRYDSTSNFRGSNGGKLMLRCYVYSSRRLAYSISMEIRVSQMRDSIYETRLRSGKGEKGWPKTPGYLLARRKMDVLARRQDCRQCEMSRRVRESFSPVRDTPNERNGKRKGEKKS